jgi:nucleotide-binding universal stress UspA family protein
MDVTSRMLVAVDGSEPSDAARRFAIRLAVADAQALRFVCVCGHQVQLGFGELPAATRAGAARIEENRVCRAVLDSAAAAARSAGIPAKTTLREGPVVDEILAEAETRDVSCIVIGTHSRAGIARMLLGSSAEGVLCRSVRPILITPSATDGCATPARLLCAFDGSPAAACALQSAAAFAVKLAAQLHVLSVVELDNLYAASYEQDHFDPDGSIGILYDKALDALKSAVGELSATSIPIELHVVGGIDTARLIADYARQLKCDLVALGVHGRHAFGPLTLGSVAERVVRLAEVPVLVLHGGTHERETSALGAGAPAADAPVIGRSKRC